MRINFIVMALLACFQTSSAWAQDSAQLRYWENAPPDTLQVQIGAQLVNLDLEFNYPNGPNPDFTYASNAPERTHLGLAYERLGFSVNIANPVSKDDERYYGSSKVTDYHLTYFASKHTYNLFLKDYSGYYVEESHRFIPAVTAEDPRYQRSDLAVKTLGTEYIYTFTPETFSLEAAYGHSGQQILSGASWIGVLNISNVNIKANRPILEGLDNVADYGEMSQFKGGDFLTIAPGIGGGGTYARDRFYATGMFAIGYGPQNQRFNLNGENYNRWVGSTSFNLKFGLGYNGKKYFAGVQAEAQPTSIAINETTLSASQLQTLLFLGYRFFDLPIPPLKALNSWLPSAETESQ